MSPRAPLCRVLIAAGCAALATPLAAQSRSPFMPPQGASNTPTAGATLEYIGYMDTTEGRLYRIYDPAKKASAWAKLNERNPDFDVLVKQHEEETLTIEHQGKTLTLAERKAKIVSAGSAAQVMPPPPQPAPANVAPAVTQSVVLNPTPADEQRRLEAVAAEVARRRALREQASQQINQGQGAIPQAQIQQATPRAMPQNMPQGNRPPVQNPRQPR